MKLWGSIYKNMHRGAKAFLYAYLPFHYSFKPISSRTTAAMRST